MSQITRCPACSTYFKVVPDQLRLSEGWVRCGQCDEVFDAHLHMLRAHSAQPQPQPQPQPQLQPQPQPQPQPQEPAAVVARADATLPSNTTAVENDPVWDWSTAQPAKVDNGPTAEVLEAPSPQTPEPPYIADTDTAAEPSLPPFSIPREVTESVRSEAAAEASFLAIQKGHRGWPWWGAVAVFCFALSGQALWHWRDLVAAHAPAAAPMLERVCQWAGCTLRPLRQIEFLVIESSSFAKVRSDVYRLSVSLRNTSPVPQALPALELSLTDAQEQSVVRKVLTPTEYGAPQPFLTAGADWSATIPLALKTNVLGSDRVAGYRLLVFYP